MVFYKCQRCGFNTNHKTNFKKHLNRKFTCKPILKEIDIYDIKKQYNMLEVKRNFKMSTQCQHNVNNNVNNNVDKIYNCKYFCRYFL